MKYLHKNKYLGTNENIPLTIVNDSNEFIFTRIINKSTSVAYSYSVNFF